MPTIRLQKYLADCGIASRRKSEELIQTGKISVNGSVVTELGSKINPDVDIVKAFGKVVSPLDLGVILFNKPIKVITSKNDERGRKTVMDYLPEKYSNYFPVGRLDYDTSGLLVMTNDGQLADRLMHPKYQVDKSYEAIVEGKISLEDVEQIARGLQLEDGIAEARVSIIESDRRSSKVVVDIHIGRNRIVRRIFEAIGHPVLQLKRLKQGPFELKNLRAGEFLKLSEGLYQKLRTQLLDLTN